jgi:hypothetical protein
MIDGLKLTMTGEQLIAKLDERILVHQTSEQHDEARQRRVDTLTLIRDHIVLDEVYRLGEYDLRFADLLPEEEWLDCGCLDRWRPSGEEETTEDLRSVGAAASRELSANRR